MKSNKNIHISKVRGDVVISQNQTGGMAAHEIKIDDGIPKKKSILKRFGWWIGFVASVITIMGIFSLSPKQNLKGKSMNNKSDKILNEIVTIPSNVVISQKQNLKGKSMNNKSDKTLNKIGAVSGDVVISQNQSGGQVAHTINNFGPPKRIIDSNIRNKILSVLSNTKPDKIGFASTQGDVEAHEFKQQLMEVFSSAGWQVQDMRTFMFFGEEKGLVVTIPFNASDQGLPQIVAHALSQTGNPVSGNRGDMANNCGIYVQVWHSQ